MARPKYTPNPFYFGDLALDEAFTDRLERAEEPRVGHAERP